MEVAQYRGRPQAPPRGRATPADAVMKLSKLQSLQKLAEDMVAAAAAALKVCKTAIY